jgi:predicted 3-demethylubiquinone-9 3-methyltransferase (glyoxalase superfamily)
MIRKLKEAGILEIRWRCDKDNETDALTKNLSGRDFERHTSTWVTDRDVNPT